MSSRLFVSRKCMFDHQCDNYALNSYMCNKSTDDRRYIECFDFHDLSHEWLTEMSRNPKKYQK